MVPHLYKEALKKEIDQLVVLGVLESVQQSERGYLTFNIPKKDNQVRFVSNFQRLNSIIKRKPYPLPCISDILQNLKGFKYAMSLDLNMGYYHICLSDQLVDLCTIMDRLYLVDGVSTSNLLLKQMFVRFQYRNC